MQTLSVQVPAAFGRLADDEQAGADDFEVGESEMCNTGHFLNE